MSDRQPKHEDHSDPEAADALRLAWLRVPLLRHMGKVLRDPKAYAVGGSLAVLLAHLYRDL